MPYENDDERVQDESMMSRTETSLLNFLSRRPLPQPAKVYREITDEQIMRYRRSFGLIL